MFRFYVLNLLGEGRFAAPWQTPDYQHDLQESGDKVIVQIIQLFSDD